MAENATQNWPVLQPGDAGEGVRAVQYLLRGYDLAPSAVAPNVALPVTGVFDSATESAVTAFQVWRDLPQTGNVDAPVWESISGDLRAKPIGTGYANAEFVRAAQTLVNGFAAKCGYAPVTVDGVFGTKTNTATKAFQRCQGLSADGLVGPDTFFVLVSPY